MRRFAAILVAFLAITSGSLGYSADFLKIAWGEFVAASDSSGKLKSWALAAAPDGMTVSFLFDALVAQAGGNAAEGNANLTGEVPVSQPETLPVDIMKIELRGHVTKQKGTTARLDVNVGGAQKTLEWPSEQEISGDFLEQFEFEVSGRRLANPFPISARAHVDAGGTAEVLLTLDSIDFSIGLK